MKFCPWKVERRAILKTLRETSGDKLAAARAGESEKPPCTGN
jgi:hypothetical protein